MARKKFFEKNEKESERLQSLFLMIFFQEENLDFNFFHKNFPKSVKKFSYIFFQIESLFSNKNSTKYKNNSKYSKCQTTTIGNLSFLQF